MMAKQSSRTRSREEGYVLLGVMLALTLILIAMAVEAPRIAQQIKREKEEELVHRGKDYATAIKRFVHKNGGRYPISVEQLEDTNHIRFLRKRYKDPMTGESDWKMVHFGEAEIKIPTPNPGLNPSGNPGLSGSNNPGLSGGNSTFGNAAGSAVTPPGTAALIQGGGATQPNQQSGNTGQLGTLTVSNIGSGTTIGGGQIIGVASTSKGKAIKEFNEKDKYDEWYFVYDLRLEQAGGTGVAVAAPRGNGGGIPGLSGQAQPSGSGVAQPGGSGVTPPPNGTPTPTPPQVPQ